jgi:hypothetical protein
MRTFLEFLQEANLPSMKGANYTGFFKLPDLDHVEPEIPVGYHKSFGDYTNYVLRMKQQQGEHRDLYAWKNTLVKFKNMAEEAISAFALRQNGQDTGRHIQSAYPNIDVDNRNDLSKVNIIYGFTESELIGGYYPRVRMQDVNNAVTRGVLQETDTSEGKRYNLNINNLRVEMESILEQLKKVQDQEKGQQYRAQALDNMQAQLGNLLWKDNGVPRLTGAR